MSFSLEKPVFQLLKEEPFFAHFLLGCTVKVDPPEYMKPDPKTGHVLLNTAAVNVTKGKITFMFNSEGMSKLPVLAQADIVAHEIMHVLLDHTGKRGGGYKDGMAKNVAMDCAINQYRRHLPEGCVTLENLSQKLEMPLDPFETYEYYYAKIQEYRQKNPQNQKGQGSGEGESEPHHHDIMDEGDELSPLEQAQNAAAIKDAADKALKAAKGNTPGGVDKALAAMNAPAQVNWKQQLRNLVANARTCTRIPTRLRANRRFELDHPGHKKERKLVIGVCVDTSGSVSDEAYLAFMNEVRIMAKQSEALYIVQADAEVQKVDLVKGGKMPEKLLGGRKGYGGTAYSPAIEHCAKLKCDVIAYFGDFDCADTPKDPGVPFIWVGVGTQAPPAQFGKVLRIV